MSSPDPQSSAFPEWQAAGGPPLEDDPVALLEADLAAPENQYAAPAFWQQLLAGEASPSRIRWWAVQLYPLVGGRWSNALFAKISNLTFADGREVFRRLYERTRDPARHPESLWRRFARAAGASDDDLDAALREPLLEARGFIEQARWFCHRSGHEAAAVCYAVETRLPALWEQVGGALRAHYGFPSEGLAFFEAEAAQLAANRAFLAELVRRYCDTGWRLYLGRRAAREVNWSWQALAERLQALAP
jgi:pyrroloquinoline quinone (PQQ) biosynthesis protein C